MEGVRSRSESPFARSKTKNHFSNTTENGNRMIEHIKPKKKNQKNKNKQQLNGKEIEDLDSNGQDYCDEEKITSNEIDTNNTGHENEMNTENDMENGNRHEEKHERNDNKESIVTTTVTEISKEVTIAQAHGNLNEGGIAEESENIEEDINVDEINSEECGNTTEIETEHSAKKDILVLPDSLPESESVSEVTEGKCSQDSNDIVKAETSGLTQDQEPNGEHSSIQEVCQTNLNGSDDSLHYQEAVVTVGHTQASDTVTKDDTSISSKITNFLGKFAYLPEQKQDSEVTSSKKTERMVLKHPYLSKVRGRRGIKDRLNSSATVFSSTEKEPKTPENLGVSLDDSFRVHTNPPRLNSVDLNENPTLRKFKGKRCLNAGDEPEEEENDYISTMKRRKLDDRTQESGILGSLLWSPFKKRSLEDENQLKLTTTESKLSRLLSPFWFWKKATEVARSHTLKLPRRTQIQYSKSTIKDNDDDASRSSSRKNLRLEQYGELEQRSQASREEKQKLLSAAFRTVEVSSLPTEQRSHRFFDFIREQPDLMYKYS